MKILFSDVIADLPIATYSGYNDTMDSVGHTTYSIDDDNKGYCIYVVSAVSAENNIDSGYAACIVYDTCIDYNDCIILVTRLCMGEVGRERIRG